MIKDTHYIIAYRASPHDLWTEHPCSWFDELTEASSALINLSTSDPDSYFTIFTCQNILSN